MGTVAIRQDLYTVGVVLLHFYCHQTDRSKRSVSVAAACVDDGVAAVPACHLRANFRVELDHSSVAVVVAVVVVVVEVVASERANSASSCSRLPSS